MASRRESPDPTTQRVTDELWDVLEPLEEGVLVLDERSRPLAANPAARSMLGFRSGPLPPRLPVDEIAQLASQVASSRRPVETTVEIWFPTRSTLRLRLAPLPAGGSVVAIVDVTDKRAAQKVRKEFVSDASHELKSPVASIQTLAEALQSALEDDPAAAARFARRLVTESERLSRLVADLLDLSRLEEGTSRSTEAVDLSALVSDETETSRIEADSKLIQIVSEIADDLWVTGDGEQLRLLVRNLLDNAVRYSSDGSRIDLYLGSKGDEVQLSVSDQGIGIPLDVQGRIFERFYRVDRARSRASGGTGLGLAIVKHVAELHGGSVEVDSELGHGSTFTARFPLGEAPTAVPGAP
jgi:signal transduction histidine kinase